MSAQTFFDILDRVKPRLPPAPVTVTSAPAPASDQRARALVMEGNGKAVLTAPVDSDALNFEEFLTRISGRLVGSEKANRNNQFWTAADLAFGLPSVAQGPLNWLHDERRVVGCLTGAELIGEGQKAAEDGYDGPPYIKADAVLWSYLNPSESYTVQKAAEQGQLYYSMECVSKQVECAGEAGCGHVMDYADACAMNERACAHVRDKTAVRRFTNPVFQGAALIVPPVKPGWADAVATILERNTAAAETVVNYTGSEPLAAQLLAYVAS